MKKLILAELLLLFLATTFISDSPPGWYQQTIPRADVVVQDIFFVDSLIGHVVVRKNTNDSAFIFRTVDGGNNWITTFGGNIYLTSIHFATANTGYSVGSAAPSGIIKKTIDGGNTWFTVGLVSGFPLTDVFFVNSDTGWTCSDDNFGAGLLKTTNGGVSWQSQLGASFKPKKLFFINKDTGWAGSSETNGKLHKTTNGGVNWNLQFTINAPFETIFFVNAQNGWIRGGTTNGIQYTTNGGFNWINAQGSIIGGFDTKFINDSIGYSGTYNSPPKILKSTDGGKNWGYQNTPLLSGNLVATLRNDSLNAWASQIMHTTDGGGPFVGIHQIGNEIPSDYKLFQNYPNPFNNSSKFKVQSSKLSNLKIIVHDITGKMITILLDERLNPGTYEVDFDGNNYSTGIYFYSLFADGKLIDTRKMLMVK